MRLGDIELNEFLPGRVSVELPVIGRTAVRVGADKEHCIGLAHIFIGIGHAAPRPDHPQRQRMGFGNRALAGRGRANRDLQQLGEIQHRRPRSRSQRPLPADDHGALRGQQQTDGLPDLAMVRHRAMRGIDRVIRLGIEVGHLGFGMKDVDRHPHMHGRRTPRGRHPEGAPQQKGDLLHLRQRKAFLADAGIKRGLVDPGQPMPLVLIDRNVRTEEDDRNRRQISLGDPRRAMRDPGARRFQHGRPARDLGIGLSREGGGALIPGQHEPDLRRLLPLLVPANRGLARQTEHVGHAMQLEHLQDHLRAVQSRHPGSSSVVPRQGSSALPAGQATRHVGRCLMLSGSHVASSGKAISTNTMTTMIRNIGMAARAMKFIS